MNLHKACFDKENYDVTLYYYYKKEGKLYKIKPSYYMHLRSDKPWIFVASEDDPRKVSYHSFTVNQNEGSVNTQANTFWLSRENDELANYILKNTILREEKMTNEEKIKKSDTDMLAQLIMRIEHVHIPKKYACDEINCFFCKEDLCCYKEWLKKDYIEHNGDMKITDQVYHFDQTPCVYDGKE